jgi:SAM-dependent methyltransferase
MEGLRLDGNGAYFAHRRVKPSDYESYAVPAYLKKTLPADLDTRILDIGCGFGQTLAGLKKIGYRNLFGIDVSDEAAAYCRSKGLNVKKIESLEDFMAVSQERFGFIIMNHVIEHIEKSRIIGTLKEIRERLLADGGVFLATVPNAQSETGCYWAYEDFTHTTIFTAGSIYYVLKSAGFERVEFLDPDCLEGLNLLKQIAKFFFLKMYTINRLFWNAVTSNAYHKQSPRIFGYELKVMASSR